MIRPDVIKGQYELITKKLNQICKVNCTNRYKLYEWYLEIDTGVYGNFFNGKHPVYFEISWEEINLPISYFKNKYK